MELPKQVWNLFVTLYLFNKSDIKTMMFPVCTFAQSLTAHPTTPGFFMNVLWTWLQLLSFTITNQSFGDSPAEDAVNKPFRPIPSKRVSLETAKVLRVIFVPLVIMFSIIFGGLRATLSIIALTLFYNEGGGAHHWITKNGCGGAFYATFQWGATLIAGGTEALQPNQILAIIGSALIVITTIHAQDFRDDEGDKMLGRKTFTLAFPRFARFTMPVTLISWTLFLLYVSTTNRYLLLGMLALAVHAGIRFFSLRQAEEDKHSYFLYNIWLCLAHVGLSGLQPHKLQNIIPYQLLL